MDAKLVASQVKLSSICACVYDTFTGLNVTFRVDLLLGKQWLAFADTDEVL